MDYLRVQIELRRVWDEIAAGAPAHPGDLDPELVQLIQRLHAFDDVPPPESTYATRLREDLMHAGTPTLPLADLQLRPTVNGHALPPAPWLARLPVPRSGRRWALAQLATAAIVLLAFIGSFFAFGPGRPRYQEPPAGLPAVGGIPATPQIVTAESLLDTMTGTLADGPGIVVFKRLTFWKPSAEPLVVLPLTGPVFIWVESGELTATEAGMDHRLAVGDHFSPAAPNQQIELRDTGDGQAAAFLVYFQSGPDLPFPRDPAVHALEVLIDGETEAGLGCPCRLLLERLTLPPGSVLPQVADPLTWFGLGQGELGLTLQGEHLPYTFTSGKERRIHVGQYQPIELVLPGTRMTLRNAGDDPLILYRLTLEPTHPRGAATGTPTP